MMRNEAYVARSRPIATSVDTCCPANKISRAVRAPAQDYPVYSRRSIERRVQSSRTSPATFVPVVSGGRQRPRERTSRDTGEFIGSWPDCGSQLKFTEACVRCHSRGYSECAGQAVENGQPNAKHISLRG